MRLQLWVRMEMRSESVSAGGLLPTLQLLVVVSGLGALPVVVRIARAGHAILI
jgi:hypothetical protein